MSSERTFDWVDTLARNLIHRAAHRTPGELRERLAEEWLADMSERRPGFSQLRFALGCCWATSIIAREHGGAAVPAVTVAAAPANLGGYIQMGPAYSSRRTVTFVLVASLHAAVLGGLMLGITQYTNQPPHVFHAVVIDQPRPRVEAPVIEKPGITSIPFDPVDPPKTLKIEDDVVIPRADPDVPKGTGTPEAPPQDPPHVVNRVHGAPGVGFPNTSDFYPDSEIRRERQGSVGVNVCTDVKGRLVSNPSLLQSSGNGILDQAALRLAKAGSGHYQPSKEDGRPVESCYGFLVQFILK
jgi:TonB family protein